LDSDVPVEAYVAALGALDDQLDLNLYVSHLQHAKDDTVRTALRLIANDRARHVAFAWAFLGSRVPLMDEHGRAAVNDPCMTCSRTSSWPATAPRGSCPRRAASRG